jgi:4'-phosphopantetheinyl transferase
MISEPLDPDTVRVRWLLVPAHDAERLAGWRSMLDVTEIEQADRFMFDTDRATYVAAHALVRAMTSSVTGLSTAALRYTRGPFGKPQLVPPCNRLCFSLSHTRGFVACAISYAEVGLDIEASDRCMNFAIADRFFAELINEVRHPTPLGRS